ncbi:Cell fusion protein cfr1 [Colletotrichum sidae]|uniref:Cell fusion protein cfr1 n=1 Tax=Colletotrichum sidae TaxID=1347389 RepID=A0A4V3I3W9_9PEZI|nr:Cell fusion protein cfr1 [Colletotrichum sidae]
MLVSLTVGKVDAGVTVLLTPDKRLIEFPSILLPPNISSGSIVDIAVSRNLASENKTEQAFRELQDRIYTAFGASAPTTPVLRCRNATQTSVVLEWDPIELATADLISLSLYRNGQKAGNIPRPLQMHSTKISGLAVDTDYNFNLVLRTTAGTFSSDKVVVRTHKMTDLSGITITTGIMPAATKEALAAAVDRIGAKIVDSVRIDTTHFVTSEGRGLAWEKAVETNIPVVRPEWVEACEKNGRILGVTKFYLDALRPSPSGDELPHHQQQTPPPQHSQQNTPQTQKELPSPPVANSPDRGERSAKSPEADEKPPAPKVEDEQESSDEEKEAEQKRITDQDDQKVRLEDKDEQNLAFRPREDDESGSENSRGDGDSKANEDRLNNKPEASPDGASFQDVAL